MTTFNKSFDDLDQQRELAFMQLRPICVSLLNYPPLTRMNSQQVLQTLDELIQTLYSLPAPSRFLNASLVEYIFFPLAHVFQSAELPRSDKFTEKFLSCLLFLLETSWSNYMRPELFKQIFIMLTSIMGTSSESSSNKSYLVSLISEETNLLAIKCILTLLGRDNQDSPSNNIVLRAELIEVLLEPSHRAAIGRCVYVLLEIIFKERLLELRISAIDAFERLVQCLEDANVLAAILPGVVSTLGKTIVHDQKENHRLLARSIEALGEIIYRVMNDEVNSHIMTRHKTLNELVEEFTETSDINAKKSPKINQSSKDISDENSNTIPSAAVEVLRSKSWLRATKSQINILLCQIFTIRNHPSWQVRLAFVNFSNLIICQCSESLDNCLPMLIETLVLYLTDEYAQVSSSSLQYLESLRENHHNFDEIFVPIMKESFDNWLNLLPQYIMGIDENAKFNVVALVTGFLSILGLHVQNVFNTSLQRVSHGLIKAMEYDLTDIQILEEKIVDIDNIDSSKRQQQLPAFPQPKFSYIREKRVVSAIRNMLRCFGYFGNLSFLVNHFFFYFQNLRKVQLCPQCVFIVNELLIGASSGTKVDSKISSQFASLIVKQVNISNSANSLEDIQRISKFLLREYTELDLTRDKEDENRNLNTNSTIIEPNFLIRADQQVDKKLEYKENFNILITNCLILEGIANIANILRRKFRVELIYALYPILEKYNRENSHIMVHEVARIALYHIAINCGYNSSKDLVLENVDYLINAISRKLNRIKFHPETTKVLIAMINVVGSNILPFLTDSIEEIFDAIDQYHMNEVLLSQLANVLYVLIKVIADDYNEKNGGESDEKQQSVNNNITAGSSTSKIKDFHSDEDIVGISREINEFVANYSKKENKIQSTKENSHFDEMTAAAKLDEIGSYFTEHRRKKESEGESEIYDSLPNDSDNIQNLESTADTNKENKPSMAQTICLNIINKLLHFLTASSPQLRKLILDLIRVSLPVLESNTQQLYPLIHQIWPSIINRMKDKEHYVILAAVELIENISLFCGDFISNRVMVDAWPLFQHILNQQLQMDKESAISYSTYSKSHRFKLSIIITLRMVIKRVLLSDFVLFQIMDTMFVFLSDKVHSELKGASQGLFIELIRKSPDAVWLVLNGMLQKERKVQECPAIFKRVVWPDYYHVSTKQVDEYVSSINLLLEKIDSIE
ncbi:12343_t:CDS:2 [Ambispora leptoticha]|uniref:12343_t:CDS:1 n=1 Tax=Ambispora leptoticha TaxID=144679 RepID=A0A9N9A7S6_9GLOM|nr:12343_t:CDS:2 [Ambispora leptoticha]